MGNLQSKKNDDENNILYILVKDKLNLIKLKKNFQKANASNIIYYKVNLEDFQILKKSDFDIYYINKDEDVDDKISFLKDFCNDEIKITKNKIYDKEYIDHTIEKNKYNIVLRFTKDYMGLDSIVVIKY